jgi:ORF6N domain
MKKAESEVPIDHQSVEHQIIHVRGQRVLLDFQLAELYGVPTKALNQAVARNKARFPVDFAFKLSWTESRAVSRSQSVTLKQGKNPKYRTYAFTEQGVAMLSSVLKSPRAIQVNIAIMRAFVRLRGFIASHAELALKLAELEAKYDAQFKVVFDAIRALMEPDVTTVKKPRIGFRDPETPEDRARSRMPASKPSRRRTT